MFLGWRLILGDSIVVRKPKSKKERLMAALSSSDDDLIPSDDGRIYVTGKLNGERILLGDIGQEVFAIKGADVHRMVDVIRFGAHRSKSRKS